MVATRPEQIQAFLDKFSYKMDQPQQYLGDEPNSYCKDFDKADVKWLMFTCWGYEQSAGNQAVPIIYKMVNDAAENYLADRFYLPATGRDLRMLQKNNMPLFGIESKRPAMDFDVVGTSISYSILSVNLAGMLKLGGIPYRRSEREKQPEDYPMVIVGGQAYGNPEFVAPIVDCFYCGEVEDEPDNPGIAKLCQRIEDFKAGGYWQTQRLECYKRLAREFSHLYFPAFMDSIYGYEDRQDVGLALPSKQVMGMRTNLYDMRVPIVKRHVRDLDAIPALTNPPLIYSDPGMGAGDLEVGRGCPAWCSFCALCLGGETKFISRDGVKVLQECVGTEQEVWTHEGWATATINQYGEDVLNTITFTPAVVGASGMTDAKFWKKSAGSYTVQHRATAKHRWPLVDGSITHDLKVGDFVSAEATRGESTGEEYRKGWAHGIVWGDGTRENSHVVDGNSYALLINTDQEHLLEEFRLTPNIRIASETKVTEKLWRVRFHCTWGRLKEFPKNESSDYVRGFIEGWNAADGNRKNDGTDVCRLSSQHPEAEEWLEEYAAYGGWSFTGVYTRKSMKTNYGTRKNPLKEFNLNKPRGWKVVSIERGAEREPVYCAEVPGISLFTLHSSVFSGNSYRQKPYRQRSVEYMVDFATEFKDNVGAVHLAPFSPDFPMHTQRKKLVKALVENVSDEVDASSMRVDDFIADGEYILIQVHSGMDKVTLGVEGNSQRMRDLVGKGASDEDVKEAIAKGLAAGIRKFKLYMIANLPGEDVGDMLRIIRLAKEIADIRDSMGKNNASIEFSWTPLLIDPNTPFQWFAPPSSTRLLGEVWEELEALGIKYRLGGKTEINKMAYYQLAQRASREHGEVICDVLDAILDGQGKGYFGGLPKVLKSLDGISTEQALDKAMKDHGFLNGLADAWDERFKVDLFGWEFIDQGINPELLWVTYQQMREFVEQTDSNTYDTHFADDYHGNEWIERCDTKCYGKTCGACDVDDLKIRRSYIQGSAGEVKIDLGKVQVIDERSEALRVRLPLYKHIENGYRFISNDHWRFAFRRAAYTASTRLATEFAVAKRSVRFVSDTVKFKDYTGGMDYLEFALTKVADTEAIQEWIDLTNDILNEKSDRLTLATDQFIVLPPHAKTMSREIDSSLWELETDADVNTLRQLR